MADRFKLTLAGGVRIETGPDTKIVVACLAQPAGRQLYIRNLAHPGGVLELTAPCDSPVYTNHGAQSQLPSWADHIITLIHHNIRSVS